MTYFADRETIRLAVAALAAVSFARAGWLLAEALGGGPTPAASPGDSSGGSRGPDWKWWLRAVGGAVLAAALAGGAWYLWGPAGSPPPGGASTGEVVTAVPPGVVEALAATVEVVTAVSAGEVVPAPTGEVSPVGRFVLERAVAEVVDSTVEVVATTAPEVVKVVFHRDLLRYADFADLADLAGRPDGPARANEALRYMSTPEGAERLKAAVMRSFSTALHTSHAGVIPRRPPEMPATAVANLAWPFEVVCESRPADWLLSDPARFAVRFARSPAASPAEWLITAGDGRVYPDLTDRMVAVLEAAEPLYRRNLDELERVGGFKTLLGDYNNQTVTDLAVKFRAAVAKSTGLAVDHGNVVGFPHRSHLHSLLVGNEAAVSAQLAVNGLSLEYTPEVLVRGVPFDTYVDLAAKDWSYLLYAHRRGMSAAEFLAEYPPQLSHQWVHHWVRTYSSENVPLPTQAVLNRYSGHFNRVVSIYLSSPANAAQPPELAHRVVHGTLKKLVQGGLSGK